MSWWAAVAICRCRIPWEIKNKPYIPEHRKTTKINRFVGNCRNREITEDLHIFGLSLVLDISKHTRIQVFIISAFLFAASTHAGRSSASNLGKTTYYAPISRIYLLTRLVIFQLRYYEYNMFIFMFMTGRIIKVLIKFQRDCQFEWIWRNCAETCLFPAIRWRWRYSMLRVHVQWCSGAFGFNGRIIFGSNAMRNLMNFVLMGLFCSVAHGKNNSKYQQYYIAVDTT